MSTLETSVSTGVGVRGPYVGLTAYTEQDAPIFFGRDAERRVLISNLRASRLTVLYARSGTGKSSLLRAGVEARLRQVAERNRAQRGGVSHFPVILGSWHDDPTDRLIEAAEAALVDVVPGTPRVNLPRTGLVDALEAASGIAGATLLVILDQFEEYLLAPSVEVGGRRRFADQLAECLNRPDLRANFLVAIREDAYSKLGDVFQSRIQNVYGNYLHLADLNRMAAQEAITQPIGRINETHPDRPPIEIEPALVRAVLDQLARSDEVGLDPSDVRTDTADGSGEIAAPYLQLVMQRLWGAELERRVADDDQLQLRLETLVELGGAGMIVRTHVDRVLRDLSTADRDAAADIFRHLVTRSGTKIALAPSDLAEYTGHSEREIQGLLGHLTEPGVRILHDVPPSPGTQTPRFEISHDLLAMPILDWCSRVQQERAAAQAADEARRHRRRTLIGAGALLALVAVLASLSTWALIERNNARESTQHAKWVAVASTAKDFADSRLGDALLLGLAAYQNDPAPAARSAMTSALEQTEESGARTILIGHTGAVLSIDVSADGTVASGGQDGTVRMWNVASGREIGAPMRGHVGAVRSVAFSPDGQTIASGGDDKTVRLWARRTGTQRQVHLPGPAIGVAFSPDGALVAVASQGGRVFLIDRRAPSQTHVLVIDEDDADLTAVAFSPDGETLVAASQDGKVFVWPRSVLEANPAPQPGELRDRISGGNAVLTLAFDPSGRMLATGGGDNIVRVWQFGKSAQLWHRRLPAVVGDVTFSPDGRTLATTDGDGTLRLWNARSGRQETTYTGHVGAASGVVFSPDGRTLTTAGFDGTLRVWERPPHTVLGRVVWKGSGPSDVNGVAYAPDGTLVSGDEDGNLRLWAAQPTRAPRWGVEVANGEELHAVARSRSDGIATAGDNGDVRLFDEATGAQLTLMKAGKTPVLSVAFSRDGRLVAGGSEDGTVRVWRTGSGTAVRKPAHTGAGAVDGVVFSPSGRVLAAASADGRVSIWTIPGLRRIQTSQQGAARTGIAFSPDGDTIAAAGADGTVRLLDASSLTQRGGALVGHAGLAQAVAFGAGGRTLVSVGSDGSLRLWDPMTHAELGDPLTGHKGRINAVAFSPDGTTLATSGADGTVRTWTGMLWRSRADLEGRVCRRVSRNLTRSEWESLVPDAPYSRPCRSR